MFRTLQRRKEHCATTTGSDTTAFKGTDYYGTNSILVSKYSDYRSPLTTGREGSSREILKRAQRALEAGAKELLKRAPQKEYLR